MKIDPRVIHSQAIVKNTSSQLTHLLTLYSKSTKTQTNSTIILKLFNQLPSHDVVSWTSLISHFSKTTLSFHHFISMLRHPTSPNQRTFASLFATCASLSDFSFGVQLHCVALKLGVCYGAFSASGLISFYCKMRVCDSARKVFDETPERDGVCFSTMIVGFAQNARGIDALGCFGEMNKWGLTSCMYSLSGVLRAVGEVAVAEQCRMIHGHCVVTGFERNVVVGTALVDGYGKCGLVVEARGVFDELMVRMSVIGWNAMMSGYAQQGDKDLVMELFGLMEGNGIEPDEYTFLAILTAFSNAGLANEVKCWFEKMKMEYGLEPWMEHYTCLIGVLGRVGRIVEAERIALTMPYEADAAVWRTLLSSCAHHGEADMALVMSKRLLELNLYDDSAYVILSNVLVSAGRLDEVREVRKLMKHRRVSKEGGKSWIELPGEVHVFLAGDKTHVMSKEIYAKLVELREEILKLGYEPVVDETLPEVDKVVKREELWYHSEKLALAFALVSRAAPPGKALRIVKNLRICRDCHMAFKYISMVVNREIIVRDSNRYHKFLNGNCSCADFW
ncbi:Pentatricopeptide repeat-containing protein [Heracleum sosnowskyi]|uniref:Pentatricopeptide repeat-containing protein n=1 Tax=Heracleum sosnowskyi TaxID=360622 RepID=A0AAD8JBJ8_9APIA|nr:Pentatricopeptide repeat-containing protein [Heracleum sosnowskyi]